MCANKGGAGSCLKIEVQNLQNYRYMQLAENIKYFFPKWTNHLYNSSVNDFILQYDAVTRGR